MSKIFLATLKILIMLDEDFLPIPKSVANNNLEYIIYIVCR